jgi:hypothetical protein
MAAMAEVSATVELFGARSCPYTSELREQLLWKGVAFVEHDVETDPAARVRLLALAGPSKRHERKLGPDAQVHPAHRFEPAFGEEPVVPHRLGIAEEALQPAPRVDSGRAAHPVHEIDGLAAVRTAHVLASMRSALAPA